MRRTQVLVIATIAVVCVVGVGTRAHVEESTNEPLRVNLNVDQTWMEFVGRVVIRARRLRISSGTSRIFEAWISSSSEML
jgi:hypothetical protein